MRTEECIMSEPFDPDPGPLSFGLRAGWQGEGDGEHSHRTESEPVVSPMSRHAAEWGLASLLCGGIMLMCMPPLVVFDLLFWLHGREVVGTAAAAAMAIVYLGMYVSAIVVIGLSLVGLVIGIRALLSASRHRQPAGLALAGTVISAAALVTTILMSVGTILIILSFPAQKG
jgi:hypothetical protein